MGSLNRFRFSRFKREAVLGFLKPLLVQQSVNARNNLGALRRVRTRSPLRHSCLATHSAVESLVFALPSGGRSLTLQTAPSGWSSSVPWWTCCGQRSQSHTFSSSLGEEGRQRRSVGSPAPARGRDPASPLAGSTGASPASSLSSSQLAPRCSGQQLES